MKIFKENSYDIVKLYVNQLGIMIFSMLINSAIGTLKSNSLFSALNVFVSVFSICFYLVLIYYVVWEIGAKDKIRIDGGRAEPCKFKGLVMGLFANIPNFLLGLLTTLFLLLALATGNEVLNSTFFLFNLVMRIHASMYMGVIIESVPSNLSNEFLIETILFTVIPFVSVLITHIAYKLGSNEKKLFTIFTRKK